MVKGKKVEPRLVAVEINTTAKMNVWGSAWKSYVPQYRRVYGCICISKSNKVLLVKGKKGEGKWSFPKGHIEPQDQSPINCALRELKEETGLILKQSFFGFKKFRAGQYYMYYMPKECEVSPRDSREVEEAKWVHLEDLKNLNKNVDVSMFVQYLEKVKRDQNPELRLDQGTIEQICQDAKSSS